MSKSKKELERHLVTAKSVKNIVKFSIVCSGITIAFFSILSSKVLNELGEDIWIFFYVITVTIILALVTPRFLNAIVDKFENRFFHTASQSVFEEFKAFTGAQQGDEARSKPPVQPEEKPKRERKHSESRRRSSGPKQSDLEKAQAVLQAQQHAVQQEKQRLKDERAVAERKRKAAEARLRKDREALEKAKAALNTGQPVKQAQPDNRTPEEIMGLNNPGYTFQDLTDARKREVSRWHTSSMGNKPQELVDLAEEELKKINLAYDRLKKKFE